MSHPAEHAASPSDPAPVAVPPVAWSDPARGQRFDAWLADLAPRRGLRIGSLRAASADASFRRYLRIDADPPDGDANADASFVVMDAPPPQEDVRPFTDIAARIAAAGLVAPRVVEAQVGDGFLLLTDLGSRVLLPELQAVVARTGDAGDRVPRQADAWMRQAIGVLVAWQLRVDATDLPAYDDALLRRELALFPDWCVAREFGVQWDNAQRRQWAAVCDRLVANALAQPQVAVHRDYMPRNLMVMTPAAAAGSAGRAGRDGDPLSSIGILDFQDAVHGPITYDVASLLRDAFIDWEEAQELDWAVRYWQQASQAGLPVGNDFGEFWRQLEWTGLQRHLKVLGIFCRLKHRDGKPAYSADLPRFFGYVHKVALRYQGFGSLARLIEPLMGQTRHDAFY